MSKSVWSWSDVEAAAEPEKKKVVRRSRKVVEPAPAAPIETPPSPTISAPQAPRRIITSNDKEALVAALIGSHRC